MQKPKALYLLSQDAFELIYGVEEQREIASLVDVIAPPLTRDDVPRAGELLAQTDVLFSGWGAPVMDERFLNLCPRLKAVFYGAGAAGHVATPMAFERGITVSSAYVANSIPVAEYALATILFSLKHGWRLSQQMQAERKFVPRDGAPGCLDRTVGLVSLGTIARTLLKLLKPFDLHVLVYDPFLAPAEARLLNVESVSLEELFRRSHVVSVHTPSLTETRGMITGQHLASMRQGATFINTARGEIVREAEMVEVLTRRPDLQAVLDVMVHEPADPTSALFDLPNVVLTPHIAGSVGHECRRMARYMIAELKRYLAGQPLQWMITPELAARSIHRSGVVKARPAEPAVSLSINAALLSDKKASLPV